MILFFIESLLLCLANLSISMWLFFIDLGFSLGQVVNLEFELWVGFVGLLGF